MAAAKKSGAARPDGADGAGGAGSASGAEGAEGRKTLPMLPFSRPVTTDEIIDRARQYGPACVDALADIAANGTDAARVSAAGALLDRGFGKVKQGVELSGTIKADVQVYRIPDNGRD